MPRDATAAGLARLAKRIDDSAVNERGRLALRVLQFLAAFVWLSWCVNLRLPADTPLADWVRPSPDICVLVAGFALFAPSSNWRPSRGLIWATCGLLMSVRCGRIANGICLRFFDRQFHVVSDLVLVPELARLVLSMIGPLRLVLYASAGLLALVLLAITSAAALRLLARRVSRPSTGNLYLGSIGVLALISVCGSPLIGDGTSSLFAATATPRLVSELELWLTARGLYDDPARASQRLAFADRWQRRQAQLKNAPGALDRLDRQDVHMILVEAYGHVVLAAPQYFGYLARDYAELAGVLERAGFSVCTDFMRVTIYGGNSWITHATLETAVPIADQFEYSLLLEQPAVFSLAKAFRAAGYRAVSVKPGTTRDSPETRMYGFDREYAAKDLGYRGPRHAWAPMPDQFVLQRIAERELHGSGPPRFLEYALVSTHFPFTPHAPYIPDWASLGDGSIFHRTPAVSVSEGHAGMPAMQVAYLSSLRYELRVLGEFIARHVRGDALVIVLGDHQPIAPVAGYDLSRSTPMHVLSRRGEFLEPFRARGCVPGWLSQRPEPHRALEDLPLDLLHDFSAHRGPGAAR